MRKWVIFVGLKVAEAVAAAAGIYMVYALGDYLNPGPWYDNIVLGLLAIVFIAIMISASFVIIFIAIPYGIRINIE